MQTLKIGSNKAKPLFIPSFNGHRSLEKSYIIVGNPLFNKDNICFNSLPYLLVPVPKNSQNKRVHIHYSFERAIHILDSMNTEALSTIYFDTQIIYDDLNGKTHILNRKKKLKEKESSKNIILAIQENFMKDGDIKTTVENMPTDLKIHKTDVCIHRGFKSKKAFIVDIEDKRNIKEVDTVFNGYQFRKPRLSLVNTDYIEYYPHYSISNDGVKIGDILFTYTSYIEANPIDKSRNVDEQTFIVFENIEDLRRFLN